MPADPELLRVVGEWVVKAENDLKTAAFTLKLQADCPTDTVCLHAQQCVEKYLKALLIWKGTPFPKTHDLSRIAKLLPQAWRPELTVEMMRRLAEYGTVTRYPGEYEPVTLAEARSAVAAARRVRKDVRAILPNTVLRRRTNR